MSTQEIEFHKIYARMSRSPWKESDLSRVVMLFDPESKGGIYLHLGDEGINGLSVSKSLQNKLPDSLRQQYIDVELIDVAMFVFHNEIERYCREKVSETAFCRIFFISPNEFFTNQTINRWKEAFLSFEKQYC